MHDMLNIICNKIAMKHFKVGDLVSYSELAAKKLNNNWSKPDKIYKITNNNSGAGILGLVSISKASSIGCGTPRFLRRVTKS